MACHCQPRRLTAYSYWCYLSGGVLLLSSFVVGAAPDGGWFMYVPLTSREFSLGDEPGFLAARGDLRPGHARPTERVEGEFAVGLRRGEVRG